MTSPAKVAFILLRTGIPLNESGTSAVTENTFANSDAIAILLASEIPLLNNPNTVNGSISAIGLPFSQVSAVSYLKSYIYSE